jgi:hypothetical protein
MWRHGLSAGGRQFFLTTPFLSGQDSTDANPTNRDFVALGKVTFGRIEVEPFAVERFDAEFGLIAQAPEGPEDIWWVTAEPGNYMAFAAPWDCGIYDT